MNSPIVHEPDLEYDLRRLGLRIGLTYHRERQKTSPFAWNGIKRRHGGRTVRTPAGLLFHDVSLLAALDLCVVLSIGGCRRKALRRYRRRHAGLGEILEHHSDNRTLSPAQPRETATGYHKRARHDEGQRRLPMAEVSKKPLRCGGETLCLLSAQCLSGSGYCS
jgi:hypothetical protein